MPTESTRAYLYRIAAAALVLLVAYGLVAGDMSEGWLQLVLAVLGLGGNGLAAANTSRK